MITIAVCAITVLASLIALFSPSTKEKLLHYPYRENREGEKYRWLSGALIHADGYHLLFNLIALFSFGVSVESWFHDEDMFGEAGSIVFLLFYVSAMLVPSLMTYQKYQNDPTYRALGASGAVSAVVFASIVHKPLNGIYVYFISVPAIIFGVLYIWYENHASKNQRDGIGHEAHLYGAFYGLLFIAAVKPSAYLDMFSQILGYFGK
jgi:membrane associated rhomboid family serine protease